MELFFRVYAALWKGAALFLRGHKRLKDSFGQRAVLENGPFAAFGAETRSFPDRDAGLDATDSGRHRALTEAVPVRLWIQAASAGEAKLCRAFVPALCTAFAAHPDFAARPLRVLCTSLTLQGIETLEEAKKTFPPDVRCLCGYLPLDRPDLMRAAVRLARPQAVILLETELWPGLMRAAKLEGVPLIVANGRISEKSFRFYGPSRFFWKNLAPDRVAAVSEKDAARYAALFGSFGKVETMPNIKFDLLRQDAPGGPEAEAARRLRAELGAEEADLLVLLASVREEEEDLLLPGLCAFCEKKIRGRGLVVAVAPRHMHRIPAWEEKLRACGAAFVLRRTSGEKERDVASAAGARASGTGARTDGGRICLCAKFGELPALYAAADAVFVGGSLVPLGGQNFLEAAACGASPLVGPHLDNFLWAGEDIFATGLARRISGAAGLFETLARDLEERSALLDLAGAGAESGARAGASEKIQARFQALLAPKLGGSAKAAEIVLETVFQSAAAPSAN
ncbi:MAG: hypothetical protein LBS65_06695 [Desulfovibrio sp.]|nr:hypothetical protein [Desulfovibrio sp.]